MLNNLVAQLGTGAGASASSFESIATYTATGVETSITFSSIVGTYKSLQIRMLTKDNTTSSSNIYLQLNSDTGSNYAWHHLSGDGATVSAGAASSTTQGLTSPTAGNVPPVSYFGAGIIDIVDYASTSKNKTIRTFGGWDGNGSGNIRLSSALWMNTSAVTSIKLYASGTPLLTTGSTFALYGIKG